MKKIISLVFALFVLSALAWSQAELVKKTILDGKVTLLLPKDFKQTTEVDAVAGGEIVLTDKSGKVNLLYSISDKSEAPVSDNDIPAYTDVLLNEIKENKMDYKEMEDGIHLQDGKNIGYLKFISKPLKDKLFNYIFYISVEDRVLSFSFTCPATQRKQWEPVADSIANSLRVVK